MNYHIANDCAFTATSKWRVDTDNIVKKRTVAKRKVLQIGESTKKMMLTKTTKNILREININVV